MELMTEKYLKNRVDFDEEPQQEWNDEHPKHYVHERCGGVTTMPQNVRTNYLADPYYYSSYLGTVCANCGGLVPDKQLFWTETGECLVDYMKRLKSQKSQIYHCVRYGLPLAIGVTLACFGFFKAIQNGDQPSLIGFIAATLIFAAIAWIPCKFIRLFLCLIKVL